jgi:hypothetical protein
MSGIFGSHVSSLSLMSGDGMHVEKPDTKEGFSILVSEEPWIPSIHETNCPRAAVLRKHALHRSTGKVPERVELELATVFSQQDNDLLMPSTVTDIILSSMCNGGVMPCGPGGCINHTLKAELASLSDQEWCDTYTSEEGLEASRLQSARLMFEVEDRMRDALGEKGPRFVVLSGHDSTFAPITAALGVYDCRWPPVRARLVFELWRKSSSLGDGPKDEELLAAEGRHGRGSNSTEAYVRVLVMGEPVTNVLEGCGGVEEFCPLEQFAKGLSALHEGFDSLKDACEAAHLSETQQYTLNADGQS